ncbi:MAG: sigma 54-interacting transcriptional regulator [Desulfarculus sp.]|nr:sigma 54-interacting transcriptional regulator [Pseudomonadota bacterium]MBU4576834.1 sigma 54-interacting transcriptional regulator [Pseudomonadota bacterium]MBU4597230.1 sigma 54-interacting transcriptional regulator [Pseudomonadota bacterium]MBV1737075.1 sigma 54-interacting transcriptional regulator [Desulfarculus sp.]MBV1753557.1 sigma 54-interacting transcriptional regulator [Desulfarculus sp.]
MDIDIASHWGTVTDTMHDTVLVVDPQGRIARINQAGEELTGYSREQIEGQSCRVLNCTGCKIIGKGSGVDYCGLFSAGEVRSKRCTITNRAGERVVVLKRASVLKDDQGNITGAVETLTDLTELHAKEREISQLRRTLRGDDGFEGLVGNSPAMTSLYRLIDTVAQSDYPVLIQGASGTGKELAAEAIHRRGPRANKPYLKVNCAALNPNLLESELFGHVKGSFTGADRDRVGRFEAAEGGDILLDEIGEIPPATQLRLLRVLQEKEIDRVGENRPRPVNARILAATNRDLAELVRRGSFREDLFYRLDVVPVQMPSLAERREDLPLLVEHFMAQAVAKSGKEIMGMAPEAFDLLDAYPWPGNVRELRHAVEYACVLCPGGLITTEHLPPKLRRQAPAPPSAASQKGRRMAQRQELIEALRQAGGNKSKAAELLGVCRATIWNRINRLDIDCDRDL